MKFSLSTRKKNLSPAKQLLLEKRLRGEHTIHNSLIRIASQTRPERLPCSYAQQRLWFIDQLEGSSTEYNMPEALRLKGELDGEALERAINTIVERHESLRTHFAAVDGEPVQVIEEGLQIAVRVEDLSGLGVEEQEEATRAAMRREVEEAFDLSRGPLLRVKVLKLGREEHILLRTMHHIVSDGWWEGVFNREFMQLYGAYRGGGGGENPLAPLRVQYADYTLWQREWLEGGALEEGLAYWKEQLAGIPERLEFRTDGPRPSVQTFAAEAYRISLSKELGEGLKRQGQEKGATLYMTLLAAFAVLLSRYSGQDDIVVGSPIANRQDASLEDLIGFFVNTLVMRVRVKPEMSFGELLGEVRRTALEAYEHQEVPFEKLVEELSPQRSLNTTPVFQVMFAVQNAPWVGPQMKDLEMAAFRGDEPRVGFDLEMYAWEQEGQIELYWLYNSDLFDRWRVEQMARHYVRVLESVAADANRRVGEVELLGVAERHQVLEEWNSTTHTVPQATLPELFEAQVEKSPEAVAVVFEEEQLSYWELNERANRLAHYLIGRGVGPEDIVGICLERSLEMVVAILGVLKAGAAYLPLDPVYPKERLAFIAKDAGPVMIVTSSDLVAKLPETLTRVELDDRQIEGALGEVTSRDSGQGIPIRKFRSSNAAYVMYTSGSTGKPKGVVVQHGALAAFFQGILGQVRFAAGDRHLAI